MYEQSNDTKYAVEDSIADVFYEQATRHAERIALSANGTALTYRELNERSNQVAHWLRQQDVGAQQFVSIMMGRSVEIVITLLGVLKAGAAYVPIDPHYPEDRIRYMMEDTDSQIVLTQRAVRQLVPDLGNQVVCIEDLPADLPVSNLEVVNTPEDVGAIIYTSGSTGKPKGTLLLQRGIVNAAKWLQVDFNYGEQDVVMSASTFSFDASVGDTFGALLSGARMHIMSETERYSPEGIARAIEQVGGTRMLLTTSLFVQFATFLEETDYAKIARSMKTLYTGGEALLPEVVRTWQRRFGTEIELVNAYGPTECTVYTTAYRIQQSITDTMTSIPIGRPLPNFDLHIMNAHMQICPVNEPGELCIGGVGVSRGYLNQPDKTAEAFLPHPFVPGEFVYKTGDLVRLLPDGNLEYIGRKDDQVKVRGFRIEIGEIESVLLQHEDVQLAAVIARRAADGNNTLYGFYTARKTELTQDELKAFIAQRVPEFMIPTRLIRLETMPLSPNGKADRKALLKVAEEDVLESKVEYAAPTTQVERILAAIWANVLKRESISLNDNFFDLGGHSLLATQVINRVQKELHVTVQLQDLFNCSTLKKLAEFMETFSVIGEHREGIQLPSAGIQAYYPLSNAQKRLWFLYKMNPTSAAYKVPMHVKLTGNLQADMLASALQAIITRHDSLRTIYIEVEGTPRQVVLPQSNVILQQADIRDLDEQGKRAWLHTKIQELSDTPFDLTAAPPVRMMLIKLSEEEHLLSIAMHHIITDGWSVDVFLKELTEHYASQINGHQPDVAPLPRRYVDFAQWQEQEIENGHWEADETYWLETLAKPLPVLDLPTDFPRPQVQTFNGDLVVANLPTELSKRVREVAKEQQVSLHMLMLSAYFMLLHQQSGSDDLIVGTPVAGRTMDVLEPMIGFFVNTVAIRTRFDGVETLSDLLHQVKQRTFEAYQHESYPFDLLIEKVNPDRDASRSPLFNVMFALRNDPQQERGMADVVLQPLGEEEFDTPVSKFDLTLTIMDHLDELQAYYEFNTDLFTRETVEGFAEVFVKVLEAFVSRLDEPIRGLELLSERDFAVYRQFNSRQNECAVERSIADAFYERATSHGERIAISTQSGSLTYAELNERSNQVAHWLRQQGVTTNQFVGVMMDRGVEIVTAILGVFKAGAAYVPIDPNYPEDRMRYMVEDTNTQIVLTQRSVVHKVPDLGNQVICIEDLPYELPVSNLEDVTPADIGAVIYTSGSTGKPKGTLMLQRSIVNFARWLQVDFGYGEQDIVMSTTTFSFDASVGDTFGALLNGAQMHILSEEERYLPQGIAAGIERVGGTRMFLTTALFVQFTTFLGEADFAKIKSMKTLFMGGEMMLPEVVRSWKRRFGTGVELVHAYGPTECTVFSTTYRIHEQASEIGASIPIGTPLPNYDLYVLNSHMQICPVNVPGELYIGGAGVARGYLNQPDKTGEAFLPHPFKPGQFIYKTGDLVRLLPNGNIDYIGRKDHQVKVRGFRIEIGEIETVLMQHADVQLAAVIARRAADGNNSLYGFYTATHSELTQQELKEFIGQQLPEFMIPTRLVRLESIPLSPNGKVDRKALAQVAEEDLFDQATEFVAPTTGAEQALAAIWTTILKREQVGVNDNFFDLGGHSLLATQVINRMQTEFNVAVKLQDLFSHSTLKQLAAYVESLSDVLQQREQIQIASAGEQAYYPLSNAQKRLWFLYKMNPTSAAYKVPTHVKLTGNLQADALEHALQAIVLRHDSLRTVFSEIAGTPRQVVQPQGTVALDHVDLSALDEQHQQAMIHAKIQELCDTPFDLTTAPPVRMMLIKRSVDEHLLSVNMHHIITDGWSVDLFLKELIATYTAEVLGQEPAVAPLVRRYVDFAQWQEQEIEKGYWEADEAYWLETLAKPLPVLDLPTDFPRPAVQTFNGEWLVSGLPAELTDRVRALAKEQQVSLHMLMLSAYFLLLHQLSGSDDIIVGTPVSGRTLDVLEPLIGFFVNTVAVRTRFDRVETLRELLHRVKGETFEAYQHESYPFDLLIEKVNPERDPSRSPLFNVLFAFQNDPHQERQMAGVVLQPLSPEEFDAPVSKFDLTLTIIDHGDELQATYEFNTDLFTRETVAGFAEVFVKGLEAFVSRLHEPIGQIELLSEADITAYERFNSRQIEFAVERTIADVFYEQAAHHGERIAISTQSGSLTYAELNERSNQIAHWLRQQGIATNQFVGVMMDRGVEIVTAILGVLKAGAAYVPIDPNYPEDRMRYMVEDTNAQVVLTQRSVEHQVPDLGNQVVCIEDLPQNLPVSNLEIVNTPADIGAVIYTSGSTGKPKGTLMLQRSIVNFAKWLQVDFGYSEQDTVMSATTFSFDASVGDTFGTLLSGARMHILSEVERYSPEGIAGAIQQVGGTRMFLTTSLFVQFATFLAEQDYAKIAGSMKTISTGGEALLPEVVRAWQRRFGTGIELVNGYGPTECTIFATTYRIHEPISDTMTSTPIGIPLPNYDLYVLNSRLQVCPVNVPGELYIGGIGVGQGYLNQPDKTEEAFLPHPFVPEQFVYKTGDLVRLLPNGNIEYIGRKDHQVKVRGYRIEIGEIESVLLQQADVQLAAVIARRAADGNNTLYGFYTATQIEVTQEELREFIGQQLPEFMIPTRLIRLETMPLSPNGKVDRKALVQVAEEDVFESTAEFVEPTTMTERLLAAIWATILKREQVGVNDNFFDLGGHSLLATQVFNRIQQEFNAKIELKDLFTNPTVGQLATLIDSLLLAGGQSDAVRIPRRDTREGYEQQDFPMSNAQKRMWFLYNFDPTSKFYNVPTHTRISGTLDVEAFDQAFRLLVARHFSLRTLFTEIEGTPRQIVSADMDIPLVHHDLGERTADEQRQAIRDLVRESEAIPFDLTAGPLVRAMLFTLGTAESHFYLNMHHIITDGWSNDVLMRDLIHFYQSITTGESLELPELEHHYVDYAQWQEQELEHGRWENQEAYWLNTLAKPLPILNLPLDFERPEVQTFNGKVLLADLPADLMEELNRLAKRQGVSMYMLLFAAYTMLMHYFTKDEDIIVGTPIAGRTVESLEPIVGFFVNTLAIRVRFDEVQTLQDVLQLVKGQVLHAFENQSYPFDLLIEKVNPERDTSRSPVFSTMFMHHKVNTHQMQVGELSFQPQAEATEHFISKFDLSLSMVEDADDWKFGIEYNTDLFKDETIDRVADSLMRVLRSFAADVTAPIGSLELLSSQDQALYQQLNDTRAEFPADRTIHDMFYEQAATYADCPAVSDGSAVLTYQELNQRSNRLAHILRANGVQTGQIVGIMTQRGVHSIVAMLGVLKAGAAYTPIDPEYPEDRIQYMLEDSGATLIVTDTACLGRVQGSNVTCISVEELPENVSPVNLPISNTADDLAYVIYTSGSTGRPKGVLLRHVGVLNLAQATREMGFTDQDIVLQFISHSFDASVGEIFPALLGGAHLHILSPEQRQSVEAFADAVATLQATTATMVPVFLNQLVAQLSHEDFAKLSSLKRIIVGGEALPAKLVRTWYQRIGAQTPIINEYGPTEATVTSIANWVTEVGEEQTNTPIGKPLTNYEVYVLNRWMQICPVNVIGEIYIGSVGLATGYLNEPEKTAEVFVPHPFSPEPGAQLYKTGDLGRLLPDGTIEYAGRLDAQVKVRGHRIEIGEIEEVIMGHPAVELAVVVPDEGANGSVMLVAFYTSTSCEVEVDELKSHLAAKLPGYMIPSRLQQLSELPLSPNGKIDRNQLPKLEDLTVANDEFVAPRSEVEQRIAKVWAQCIRYEQVGVHDNFFGIGGDSIVSMQVVSGLKQAGLAVKISDLFKYQTVAELAAYIEEHHLFAEAEVLVDQVIAGEQPLSHVQRRTFASRMEHERFVAPVVLDAEKVVDPLLLQQAVQILVNHHDMLRVTFAVGAEGVKQIVRTPEEVEVDLVHVDLTAFEDAVLQAEYERVAREMINSLSFDQGVLMRVVLFRLSEATYRVFWLISHLVNDAVSLSILQRDLIDVYEQLEQGMRPSLPSRSTSYGEWTQSCIEFINSEDGEAVFDYWTPLLEQFSKCAPLKADYPNGTNRIADSATMTLTIDQDTTEMLRGEVSRAHGMLLHELLLTATMRGVARWSEQNRVSVMIHGHGRNQLRDEDILDLSRTVGFFATSYPVYAEVAADQPISVTVEHIRCALERLPQGGASFDMLHYLNEDASARELFEMYQSPEVLFNFYGAQFERHDEVGDWNVVNEFSMEFPKDHELPYKLVIFGIVEHGSIQLSIGYSEAMYRVETIERLTSEIEAEIQAFVMTQQATKAGI